MFLPTPNMQGCHYAINDRFPWDLRTRLSTEETKVNWAVNPFPPLCFVTYRPFTDISDICPKKYTEEMDLYT